MASTFSPLFTGGKFTSAIFATSGTGVVGFSTWLIGVLLAGTASAAQATTLDYDAYVGDAKVGEAQIIVERNADRYQIQGKAHAVGVMEFVTQWRTRFSATGRVDAGHPVVQQYSLIERARNKIKEIFLSDGQITYTKNGRSRPPRELGDGLDLLSALFVSQDCGIDSVHNGKDSYRLHLTDKSAVDPADGINATVRCRFEVTNEDDEQMMADVWLGTVDDIVVPVRLDFRGALEGSLRVGG